MRTFVQSKFIIARFLEALGTFLIKNRGLTREWLLIRARPWHPRVSRRIFLENRLFLEKFWKWWKIPSEWTANMLIPVRFVTCGRQWECVHSCGDLHKRNCIHAYSQICTRGSTNTLYFNSCTSSPWEPNFTQLAQKKNNKLLFWFIPFSLHISVAASCSVKCLSHSRGSKRPKAAVFIKGMQCCAMSDFVTRNLMALQIKIDDDGANVGSGYCIFWSWS